MNSVYAMDTYFTNSLGVYPWEMRCEMLRELGYNETYLTLWSEDAWEDLPKIAHAFNDFGLHVSGVYWTLDLDDRGGANHRFLEAMPTLPAATRIELAIVGESAFDVDDARLKSWLETLLQAADEHDLQITLYPHLDFWLDRLENALQVARKYLHPRLGAVFCGYHWFGLPGQNLHALPQLLKEAAPLLRAVNLCGSSCKSDNPRQCTIETLDRGELDNASIAAVLREINYDGPVGFQGYGIGGDAYANLHASLNAWRDMQARLDKHPHWMAWGK